CSGTRAWARWTRASSPRPRWTRGTGSCAGSGSRTPSPRAPFSACSWAARSRRGATSSWAGRPSLTRPASTPDRAAAPPARPAASARVGDPVEGVALFPPDLVPDRGVDRREVGAPLDLAPDVSDLQTVGPADELCV